MGARHPWGSLVVTRHVRDQMTHTNGDHFEDPQQNHDRPETRLPTKYGNFLVRMYQDPDGSEPLAIISGRVKGKENLPVRVHSACFTSESLGSLRCDCREQLEFALRYIAANGGIVIYLHQEGRGIGLAQKIRAYALQEKGYDTVDANGMLNLPHDARTYETAASILRDLGVASIRLISNNPHKIEALQRLGTVVSGRIPVVVPATEHSAFYLHTKVTKMGHIFSTENEIGDL